MDPLCVVVHLQLAVASLIELPDPLVVARELPIVEVLMGAFFLPVASLCCLKGRIESVAYLLGRGDVRDALHLEV